MAAAAPVQALVRASTLSVATAYTAGVAARHIWATAQQGIICGLNHAGDAHCWACFATPALALAAAWAWGRTTVLRPSLEIRKAAGPERPS